MKHLKKVITLVLAVATAFALATPALAADGDQEPATPDTPAAEEKAYDHPLTVEGLGSGDKAHFYQVIEWVGETSDHSDVSGWKAVAPFATYLTKAKLTEILVGTPAVEADPDNGIEAKDAVPATGITSVVAGEIAKLATGAGTEVHESDGKATLDNAKAGMWMALIDPADANTIYNPVFVSADYNKDKAGNVSMNDKFADAIAKKSSIPLKKTAENAADYNKDNAKTTAVGDTVTFKVETTIPTYGFVYEHPHFVVKDSLTDLKLKADTVKVEGLTKGTDYTVETTDGSYTITFKEEYLKGLKAAKEIVITYDAIVTDSALKAVNEEDNKVTLEYSHDPKNQSDYDVNKDTTQHYTFSIDAEGAGEGQSVTGKKTSEVVKVGVKADGTPITETTQTSQITSTEKWEGPLEGAKFGLYTDKACTKPYKAKKADGTEGTDAMVATTGADGRMNFKGLDAGTYYLKEISAPAGYVTNSDVHTIVIDAQTKSVKVTEWWNGSAWVSTKPTSGTAKEVTYDTDILESYTVTIDGEKTAEYKFKNQANANSTDINWEIAHTVEKPFQLKNTQGTELPSTGGMGTKILYTIGGLMVVAGGVFLAAKKRMSTIEE